MSQIESEVTAKSLKKLLPEYWTIQEYPKDGWACILHLTTANEKSAQQLLSEFRQLMHRLGWSKNKTFGRRLHWIARVGGGDDKHIHLHALIGNHKLVNGKPHRFTPSEICEFIKAEWKEAVGICKIEPFDSSRGGIAYVLRRENQSEVYVEFSEGLKQTLKKLGNEVDQPAGEGDPLVEEVLAQLNANGTVAGTGAEMQKLRLVR